jgi:hypothetical protein
MRGRLITLALLVLVPGTALGATVDQGALNRCIARNSLRFTQPGDALAAQYVDIAAACRAALAKNDVAGISVSGGDGGGGGGSSPSSGGGSEAAPTATTTTPAPRPPLASPATAAARRTIDQALARDAADTASPLAGLGALPWQYWLGIALTLAVVAALAWRTGSRRTTDTE